MSYLIGMYIYYHGNNLVVFGITKGARDEELKNEGLKRPDEIDPSLVNPKLIAEVKKQEELDELTDRYKRVMAEFENYKKRSSKSTNMGRFDATCNDWITKANV